MVIKSDQENNCQLCCKCGKNAEMGNICTICFNRLPHVKKKGKQENGNGCNSGIKVGHPAWPGMRQTHQKQEKQRASHELKRMNKKH